MNHQDEFFMNKQGNRKKKNGSLQERIYTLGSELKAIRKSELNYRILAEHGPEGIVVMRDNPFRLVYVNPAMSQLTGRTSKELSSSTRDEMINWVYEQDRDACFQRFQDCMRGLAGHNFFEFRLIRKDGAIVWLDVSSRLVRYKGKPSILAVCMDITERKLAEERAGKLEGRMRQAQKMDAIGILAGGIAHDFNNLLMGIQGYTSLMLIEMDPGQPHYERLRSIEDQVRRGAELTRQLLAFARSGRYEVKPLNLNEMIRHYSVALGKTKKELTICRRLKHGLWTVEADQGQIEKVLTTLFTNAWQAMPGGGDLMIETSNTEMREDHSLPYQVSPGRYVRVSVSDTGMGMDEQTQQRVFDPFFTTKAMGRGTGLGLATVYGIIKGHGGFIQVESTPGNGTTFTFFLPASARRRRVSREIPTAGVAAGPRKTVLVVDDEPANMEVTKEILELLNYNVQAACTGAEAVTIFQEHQAEIDLIILDMIMPGMSGGETFDRLKQIDSDVRVLLSSGYSLEGQAKDIMDRGCLGFIQKPYKIEELAKKIQDILP